MLARLSTIDDLDVEDQRVLLRADLNVPLASVSSGASMSVTDDTRIRVALPTIEELLRRGARLVLASHLDCPNGRDRAVSMRPVAERLGTLTGANVPVAPGVTGAEVRELTERLAPGAMLMLENVRWAAGETRNDRRVASALAELADLYVNDALGSAHRAHASTEGVAHLLPNAAGRLMEREIHALSAIVEEPARPLVAILGGARVRDNLGVLRRFLDLADVVCLGGAICLPFLALRERGIGRSRCQVEDLEPARLAVTATAQFSRLEFPSDLQLDMGGNGTGTESRAHEELDLSDGGIGFDIGPDTVERYGAEIERAATVFWSGTMGRPLLAPFADGTRAIAEAIASTSATTVVGGAETVQAVRAYGLHDRVSHLSTGGRATLEFLEGLELPGVEVLRRIQAIAR